MRFSLVILFILSATVSFSQQKAAHQSKPNIIFILTDDHRWDALGVAGNKIIQTPNLDQLANEGLYFKNSYVTTSICCVSRASLLTGQYESRHQINNFKTDLTNEALQKTYPILLKNAGYKIGFVGKYGVGLNHPSSEFDYWSCSKKEQPPYIYLDNQGKKVHNTVLPTISKSFLINLPKKDRFVYQLDLRPRMNSMVNHHCTQHKKDLITCIKILPFLSRKLQTQNIGQAFQISSEQIRMWQGNVGLHCFLLLNFISRLQKAIIA